MANKIFHLLFKKSYAFHRVSNDDDDDYGYFTLTFNIEFPHDNDTVYFAHSYPYTYSDLQVSSIQSHHKDSITIFFLNQ